MMLPSHIFGTLHVREYMNYDPFLPSMIFSMGPDRHDQFMPLGSDSLASLEKALSLLPIGVFNKLLENEPHVQQMACHLPLQQHFVRPELENLLLEYNHSHWVIVVMTS